MPVKSSTENIVCQAYINYRMMTLSSKTTIYASMVINVVGAYLGPRETASRHIMRFTTDAIHQFL
jgi:hypothetical protein